MKSQLKEFKLALYKHAIRCGWPELVSNPDAKFKSYMFLDERMYEHCWFDGPIECRDTYHFENNDVILFRTEKRYGRGERWMEEP